MISNEITSEYLQAFHYKEKVPLKCQRCQTDFTKNKHEIQNHLNRGRNIYCSRSCNARAQNELRGHGTQNVACDWCGLRFDKSKSEIKKTKHSFCNRSCSAKYYNKHKPKKLNPKTTTESTAFCELCNEIIFLKKRKTNGYFMKRFCDICKFNRPHNIINKTKGELFANMANWQSARSCIQKNARKVFNKSGRNKECCKCGYDKHFEICHIKDVASFKTEALISEINNIKNLIALCPNHHWELDNGLLSIEELRAVPGLEPGLPAY